MERSVLEAQLAIDEQQLDRALSQQAQLYYEVTRETALACSRRDDLKAQLSAVYATLDAGIRAASSDKITEGKVKNTVEIDATYQAAQASYLEAKLEAELWSGLRESWHQRSYMLREMATLVVSGYVMSHAVEAVQTGPAKEVVTLRARKRVQAAREKKAEAHRA